MTKRAEFLHPLGSAYVKDKAPRGPESPEGHESNFISCLDYMHLMNAFLSAATGADVSVS